MLTAASSCILTPKTPHATKPQAKSKGLFPPKCLASCFLLSFVHSFFPFPFLPSKGLGPPMTLLCKRVNEIKGRRKQKSWLSSDRVPVYTFLCWPLLGAKDLFYAMDLDFPWMLAVGTLTPEWIFTSQWTLQSQWTIYPPLDFDPACVTVQLALSLCLSPGCSLREPSEFSSMDTRCPLYGPIQRQDP